MQRWKMAQFIFQIRTGIIRKYRLNLRGSCRTRYRSPGYQILLLRRCSQTRRRSWANHTRAPETLQPNSDRQDGWSTVIDDSTWSLIRNSHRRQHTGRHSLNLSRALTVSRCRTLRRDPELAGAGEESPVSLRCPQRSIAEAWETNTRNRVI